MDFKWVFSIVTGIGCVIASYCVFNEMSKGYNHDVETALDRKVYEKFGRQSLEAKNALDIAKADAQKIFNAEHKIVNDNLLTNVEYQTARATVDASKNQIDILKKSLKTAQEGSSTQVAVGSGSSAVAVSVKDTSQIAKIQLDISNLEKELKVNRKLRDTIWQTERAAVQANRTPEQKAILDQVSVSEKAYNKVKFEKELYKNELRDDGFFMETLEDESFINNFKPGKMIFSSILFTIPFVLLIFAEWKNTIGLLIRYRQIVKGV